MTKTLNEDGNPVMDHDPAPDPRQQVAMQGPSAIIARISSIGGAAANVLALVMQASLNGTPKDALDFMKQMYNEERAYEAKLAFNAAMAKARMEFKPIKKTKHVKIEPKGGGKAIKYDHEELANVLNMVGPILGKHGLVPSHRIEVALNSPVKVTCVIKHDLGHEDDSCWMEAGRDDSGAKSLIQQASSTLTYLKRYTLMAALGIAAEGDDDDGRGSEGEDTLSDDQVREISDRLTQAGAPLDKFLKSQGGFQSLADMPANRFEHLKGVIANWVVARDKLAAEQKVREEQQQRAKSEEGTVRDAVTKAKPRTMI